MFHLNVNIFFTLIILINLASLSRGLNNTTLADQSLTSFDSKASENSARDHEISQKPTVGNGESKFYKIYAQNECYKSPKVFTRQHLHECVKNTNGARKLRILVTGGAGFVGSHLVDSLMLKGHHVIVCDNFHTGRLENIEHWSGHDNFELLRHDVIVPLDIPVDSIYHLASPASPPHYMADPIRTIKTNSIGTLNVLDLAKKTGARVVIASTSEVYGDPEVHPQEETYWGHVNPVGPRSCYDESKRLGESLASAYHSQLNVSIGISRIFNTYGPRMHPNDGRVISNFITQALSNDSITIYGSGEQTRSFQFISDLVDGLERLMESNLTSPVNLGNPNEMTILSLAKQIQEKIPDSTSKITFKDLPIDDPHKRRPDIKKAMLSLKWHPKVSLDAGLNETIEYFRQAL